MRKYLVIMIVILIFVVPYIAVAGDYDSGVKATLILKTATTPVKLIYTGAIGTPNTVMTPSDQN
jgi:hypothetical protein